MTTTNTTAYAPHNVIADRLNIQRERVLRAHGICMCAAFLAGHGESDGSFDANEWVVLRSALEGLGELLDSIKMAIDPEDGALLLADEVEAQS